MNRFALWFLRRFSYVRELERRVEIGRRVLALRYSGSVGDLRLSLQCWADQNVPLGIATAVDVEEEDLPIGSLRVVLVVPRRSDARA